MKPTSNRRGGERAIARVATALIAALAATVLPLVASSGIAPAVAATPLTNLDHLNWLTTQVDPPDQDGHTTYRLAEQPEVGVLWTYAEPDGSGGWKHVGGGEHHADGTWGQGAYNADDIARAAVVYLRHWQQTGDTDSRDHAYQLLRGLTYLQTSTGDNAGNVVLWMQPDGTLNPSAEPKELPDPSDSGPSYWLARTIWALGEGYAAFQGDDPQFASFLKDRLDLSIGALDRQVLDKYGEHLDIDGEPAPAWLITDGADASAEAALGLAAYVKAGGTDQARTALKQLTDGISELSDGDARTWPFGARRPWALSRSMWHGWGAQMPSALARASTVLGDSSLYDAAAKDSFTFDPWMLTSGGPDNGRLPTRIDRSQIAYGVDARLQGLLATGDANASVRDAANALAGIVGAWYFGANPAGEPMYDPATGVTYDGIGGDGKINHNSGAESTIHGLLSMLALDAHPDVAAAAQSMHAIDRRVGTTTVQAEEAKLIGDARAVTPESLWTGESQYGGTGYVELGDGSRAVIDLPAHPRSLVLPVVDLRPGSSAVTTFATDDETLGSVRSGDIGPQGDSPAPGALLPVTLDRSISKGIRSLTATTTADGDDTTRLDAVMLEPVVSRLVLSGDGHGTALLSSRAAKPENAVADLAGHGPATVSSYDGSGHLVATKTTPARRVHVRVPPGGFAVVSRFLRCLLSERLEITATHRQVPTQKEAP
ncbi:MAG: hypothetical protein ACTHKG_00920 [Nocardioides sp.]